MEREKDSSKETERIELSGTSYNRPEDSECMKDILNEKETERQGKMESRDGKVSVRKGNIRGTIVDRDSVEGKDAKDVVKLKKVKTPR